MNKEIFTPLFFCSFLNFFLLLLLFTNVPLVTEWSMGILKHFCKVHAMLDSQKHTRCFVEPIQLFPHPGLYLFLQEDDAILEEEDVEVHLLGPLLPEDQRQGPLVQQLVLCQVQISVLLNRIQSKRTKIPRQSYRKFPVKTKENSLSKLTKIPCQS